jgi:CheY-like chemotaxis protein
MTSTPTLASKRVLIVEDELLVAMLIEDVLIEQGCEVLGPYSNVPDGLEAARRETFDIAVLDVNLRGEKVFPIAEVLTERGIPFVLLSGYGQDAVPPGRPKWRVCGKPFAPEQLMAALTEQACPDGRYQ